MTAPASTPRPAADTADVVTLGPQDHTYLHLDTKSRPMHWAMLLELAPDAPRLQIDTIRTRLAERAQVFDILRLGVTEGRWRSPHSVLADTIDPIKHSAVSLFSDISDLRRQLSTLLETHLPRSLPLWQLTLFTPNESHPDAQSADTPRSQYLLLRVHHSISDGIAGAAFSALLADDTGDGLAEFERFATSPRFHISGIDPTDLKRAKAAFNAQWEAAKTGRGWPRLTRSGRRDTAWYSIPTRDLRRCARRADAGVHEFLLGAVGATISAAPPHGSSAQNVRVTLPVTLDKDFRHTGNAVAISLLNLSGTEPDLLRQVARSRNELAVIERERPELALAAADDAPRAPWPIFRAISAASMARMSPDIHIGVNPGFSRVRSILGAPLANLTALSPLAGYSFSVTCLILGGQTSFGVVTDPEALPGYAETFVAEFGRTLTAAAST